MFHIISDLHDLGVFRISMIKNKTGVSKVMHAYKGNSMHWKLKDTGALESLSIRFVDNKPPEGNTVNPSDSTKFFLDFNLAVLINPQSLRVIST